MYYKCNELMWCNRYIKQYNTYYQEKLINFFRENNDIIDVYMKIFKLL